MKPHKIFIICLYLIKVIAKYDMIGDTNTLLILSLQAHYQHKNINIAKTA